MTIMDNNPQGLCFQKIPSSKSTGLSFLVFGSFQLILKYLLSLTNPSLLITIIFFLKIHLLMIVSKSPTLQRDETKLLMPAGCLR